MFKKFLPLAMILFTFLWFGLVIYDGSKSDSRISVLTTISRLESNDVENIVVEPKNLEWKINLIENPIVISDTAEIAIILHFLKTLKKTYPGKGLLKIGNVS